MSDIVVFRFRTFTKGKDTGPEGNDKAFHLRDDALKEFLAVAARLDTLAEQKDVLDSDWTFITVDCVKFVQNVLNAVYAFQPVCIQLILPFLVLMIPKLFLRCSSFCAKICL